MTKAVWDKKSSRVFDASFDCYIAEALLSEGRAVKLLDETLKKYSVTTLDELAGKQQAALEELSDLNSLFSTVEAPLSNILMKMEERGILLDTKKLTAVGEQIDTLLSTVQEQIVRETGGGVNLNSPLQLGHFLAEKIGIPLGRTKTGKYATGEGELSKFRDQFPIIAHILTYRELNKLRSTYVASLIEKVDAESRIHTTYHQVATNTGRLASSNPNLQNIPVTSPIGREIKSCFVASPGHIFVSMDYSQQELRILAHLTQEKALIQAFADERDVHVLTASKIFNTKYEEVSPQQRSVGKTINFGIIYGMSSYGMSAGLKIPQEDAEEFINQFYISYPSIKTFYNSYFRQVKTKGVAETLLGRRWYVFEDPKRRIIDNSTRRVLMNYPIQGAAADLMKKAMVDVAEKVLVKNPDVHLLLQIHDDLVFEIPDSDMTRVTQLISEMRNVLCSVYPLSVPVIVDVKMGKEWGDLQKVI